MIVGVILEWSSGGFFPSPFLGVEGWSGAEEIFWSGVRKGVKLQKNWSVPKSGNCQNINFLQRILSSHRI